MLRFLSIERLAVIDEVEVEFAPGLNVLTGETGAGKSIVVGAVELLLGGRASADLVRTGAETARVQAVIETASGQEILIRRELSPSGRSRAFVDGSLVTAAELRDLAGPLIDLHGQHEHQALLSPAVHLDLLDRHGGLEARRAAVAEAFARFEDVRRALEGCRLDDRERAARAELLAFQLGEIDKVMPKAGEDDDLHAEHRVLANTDRVLRTASDAYLLLYEGDTSILGALSRFWRHLEDLSALDPRVAGQLEARDQIRLQLTETAEFLRRYVTTLEASPERLQQVEERLAQVERLKRRYGPTLVEVLARQASLKTELDLLGTSAERAAELQQMLASAREVYLSGARELSRLRRRAAADLSSAVERGLAELAMERARFEVRFDDGEPPESRWSPAGIDVGEFYLSANPGEALRPLARIASGGELSRITLALKTVTTTDLPGKTLVFDEVDAGIGGRVADVVGARLKQLGEGCQVLCITHLPQVAAHAHVQFRVSKRVSTNRTETAVERLSGEARVEELARMIGGAQVTDRVLAGAREMLASRGETKQKVKGESERAKAKGRRGEEIRH